MKDYKKILVFENDSEHIGKNHFIKGIEKNETITFDMWWDFAMSFYWDSEKAFQRLKDIDSDTLVLSNPSFAGPGNSFSGYLNLFLKMKEMNIKLDMAVIYYNGFFNKLLHFLYSEQSYLKLQNNHRMLQEVLEFHNIYEIEYENVNLNRGNIKNSSKLITWESLAKYYFETHRRLDKTMVRVKATGEIYQIIYVNNHKDNPEDYEFELLVYETPFKSMHVKFNEIERV